MRSLSYFFILSLIFSVIMLPGCSGSDADTLSDTVAEPEDAEKAMALLDSMARHHVDPRWDTVGTMPDDDCEKLQLNYPGPPLRQLFRDSNYLHYITGEQLGITPIAGEPEARNIRRPLDLIKSDQYIYVDSLRHSYPYLIPEAHALLNEIALRFHDTLQARGGGNYRLKITSLLRTPKTVSRLRRVNRASVDSSAHLFGTTFDISYTYFPYNGGSPHRTQEDLKNLLAEILYALRNDNRCYVIYERKQGCFHVTTRPKATNK